SIQPATSPWSWLPASISSSPPAPSARPSSSYSGPARPTTSRCGPSRSSSPSPRMTTRSTPRAASISGSRSSARRSRSARVEAPRWRSEITSVRTGRSLAVGMSGPLTGLIVADFSRVLAGPYASMLLGDLGADVIKVERPGTGDDTRAWGPPWRDGESTYYLSLNRNKRSVVLDLAGEEDRALARALGERADVMIESFRPGLMASWGLDGDSLRAVNPRLVSCSVTAFGSGEAAAGMPGYDFLLQAMGGLMSVTGEPDGRPLKTGAAVVDLICGLLATIGIQAALAGGGGRHVEVSLMDSVLAALLNQGTAWVAGGVVPGRRGN